MDNSAVGMCLVSPEGAFIRVNHALCELLARDEATVTSSTWQELTHPDDLDMDLSLMDDVLAGRIDSYRLLKRFLRPDGSVVWGDLSVGCVRDETGSVRSFVSQIVDVTDRETALAALVESQELFHLVMDGSAVGMSVTSPDGGLVRVNASLCALFGRTAEELTTTPWQSLTPAQDVATEEGLLEEMRLGLRDTYRLLKRFERPDGTAVRGDVTISLRPCPGRERALLRRAGHRRERPGARNRDTGGDPQLDARSARHPSAGPRRDRSGRGHGVRVGERPGRPLPEPRGARRHRAALHGAVAWDVDSDRDGLVHGRARHGRAPLPSTTSGSSAPTVRSSGSTSGRRGWSTPSASRGATSRTVTTRWRRSPSARRPTACSPTMPPT